MKTLPSNITVLLQDFSEISDIKEKFEFLLEISEDLEFFPENQKIQENKIQGCASDAWILVEGDNPVKISGEGDAVISKGILAFFIQCFEGLSASEILQIRDAFPEIFTESGVISSLSPSRANGAKAMLDKIYSECEKNNTE